MFKVQSDKTKNRLFITLGDLSLESIKPILAELTDNIAQLKPGFTCLVDIRSMSVNPRVMAEEYIEIIQGALADSGMGKVARVVNQENEVFFHRMETTSQNLGYSAVLSFSIEEAEKVLDAQS